MRAVAVFPTARQVRVIDHPEPVLTSATQAKMRVLEVGVCGTDREIISFQFGTPPEGSDYLIIGHESLSEVVEIGSQVTRVKAGDLVIMTVRRPCQHTDCVACRRGRQDFCYTGDYTERGIKQSHGYMTELVVEEECYLNPVPRELREVARAGGAVDHRRKIVGAALDGAAPPSRGTGNIARWCSARGRSEFWVRWRFRWKASKSASIRGPRIMRRRIESSDAIGIPYIAAETHSTEEMARMVGPIDVVYEATGASSVAFDVLQTSGPNAVFVLTGVPGHKDPFPWIRTKSCATWC